MKKYLVGIGMSAMLAAANVSAAFVSGDLQLRDAIYLYDQGVDARGSKTLGSSNCDVFQLVLDVTTGYTDLGMGVGNANPLNSSVYPDRIHDSAAMFAYALYGNDTWKVFGFNDKANLASSTQIGKGAIFGYCYSTKPDAYVYFMENDKCTVKFSDGSIESIPNCAPTSTPAPTPTPAPTVDLSSLVGTDSYVWTQSTVSGSGCAGLGLSTGTDSENFSASASANGSQLTFNLWTYGSYYTFTLNYQSGNAASGFNFSGTFHEAVSGLTGTATALSLKRVSGSYSGFISGAASNCTVGASMS